MSEWRNQALRVIKAVHEKLPEGATLNERRKALDAEAYWAHQDTSWGRKVWAREKRQYLQRHGLKPKQVPIDRPGHVAGPSMRKPDAEGQLDLWFDTPAPATQFARFNCAGKLVL